MENQNSLDEKLGEDVYHDELNWVEEEGEFDPDMYFVSNYLKNHKDFAKNWFTKHACQDMVEEWLSLRGLSNCNLYANNGDQEKLFGNSYENIPRGGRNSVTSEIFHEMVLKKKNCNEAENAKEKFLRFREESQSQRLHENEVMMEFIRDVSNELDIDTLCHKILVNVCLLTNSDRASLFLAKGSRKKRFLVAKLFDVTADSALQNAVVPDDQQSKIPPIAFGVGIIGHVAESKETVNIRDAYQDPRFNKDIDSRTGYRTMTIMCMPILNFQGDVIGVAQCINKLGDQEFTEQDEEVFKKYLIFCGIGIQNAQLFEMSVQEYKRNQVLLSLAQSIFEETSSLNSLIHKIMVKTKELLKCQKCRVYLVDSEQQDMISYMGSNSDCDFRKVAVNLEPRKFSNPEDVIFATVFELRDGDSDLHIASSGDAEQLNSLHFYFARLVAATGQTFSWTDEETETEDQIEYIKCFKKMLGEEEVGTVVSIPVFNSEKKVIGVAQLENKFNNEPFHDVDVITFEAFSIFCGLGIHNTQMYENAIKLMAKQRVGFEVLSYHASSSIEETRRLIQGDIPSADTFNLYDFNFNDFNLPSEETCKAVLRMFIELDIITTFHISYEVLCRWVLTVRKNYRPVIYHNWRHALNVTQTMFAMVTTGGLQKFMGDLEILALLVACLSHDLDHRGTNNSFQSKISSPLATLYGTSTMEHHHFDHCIMILNSEGNNILQSLSPEKYREIIHIIESAILSTDLALYFKKKDSFIELMESGNVDWKKTENMEMLRGMMMTACDISAICKPWEVQRQTAELVASEFFEQGDLEKEQLKEKPIAMMDRNKKHELPKLQVNFIDYVGIPVYKVLSNYWPELKPLYQGCQENKANWQKLNDENEIDETVVEECSTCDKGLLELTLPR